MKSLRNKRKPPPSSNAILLYPANEIERHRLRWVSIEQDLLLVSHALERLHTIPPPLRREVQQDAHDVSMERLRLEM